MRHSISLLALLFLFAARVPATAAEVLDRITLGGYFKSLTTVIEAPPVAGASSGEFSSNRLRVDGRGRLVGRHDLAVSLENQLLYTDPTGLVALPRASINRRLNLDKTWNRGRRWADRLEIDRLNLRTTAAGIDWTLGRQAVGFGRITLFSPLDIIAPFAPDALDTEVRPGVDALRASRYVGVSGQISLIGVFGDGSQNNSYLATAEENWRGVDLLLIGGMLRERPLAGFGVAGQWAGMGIKGEAVYYRGRDAGDPGGDLHDDFAVAAVEMDYRFENGLILFLQYLYNGAGVGEPEDYLQALASAPLQEGLAFLAARHYLLVSPSYDLHPLVNVNALLIWNLADDSFFLRPLLDVSLSDNLVLQLFWTLNRGRKPEKFPLPLPRSEFGSLGDNAGLFLKYFF